MFVRERTRIRDLFTGFSQYTGILQSERERDR